MTAISKERYFDLQPPDQAELLHSLTPVIGVRAEILEKDIWLCQILDLLFHLPCSKPMAFKGGTSLSKVYRAIDRFSEDIDVTIDYRSLDPSAPELDKITSNNQRNKLSKFLKSALAKHIIDELVPELQEALLQTLTNTPITLEVSSDAEKIWVYYPSAVENSDQYLRPSILIEFGGRNSTLPQNKFTIKPDIADLIPNLRLPSANISVLSGARTFWEKATLIHVECHRPNIRTSAQRISRHWYDLARLVDHQIGQEAIHNKDLLLDVLLIKQTFYHSEFSNYYKCTAGKLRLVPDKPLLHSLKQDYQAMINAQMFYSDAPNFEQLIERLRILENKINTAFRAYE